MAKKDTCKKGTTTRKAIKPKAGPKSEGYKAAINSAAPAYRETQHAARPQQSARPKMGRTANAKVFYKFDFGARFMTERPIRTDKGAVLVPAGEVITITEIVSETARKIAVVGKNLPHYIVTTGQLYKGVAA